MVVVAVGLVGDALRRTEVHAARQGLAGGVVDDAGVDPVAALFRQGGGGGGERAWWGWPPSRSPEAGGAEVV